MAQVWLVTGSSRGLGRAIVEAGLAAGNKVLATARDVKSLADLSERHGDQVKLFAMDVTPATILPNGPLKASVVTRAVRTPSRIDEDLQLTALVQATPPVFACICDNGQVASETLLGYEAGYRKLVTSSFYVDVAAFHNKYNDLVSYGDESISIVASPPPPYTLISLSAVNGIMGSSNGGEISPDWKVTHWMDFKATYSLMRPLYPLWKMLFPNYVTTTECLGRAMLNGSKRGFPNPVLENRDINRMCE